MKRLDIKLLIVKTRYKFVGASLKKIEALLDGKEIEFSMDNKKMILDMINERNLEKSDDIEFLYNIIPLVSNVDVISITLEEFKDYCNNPPTEKFVSYINALMDYIKEELDKNKLIQEIESESNKLINKIDVGEKLKGVI